MISTFKFFVIFICPSEDQQHPFQHTFPHVSEICLISNELVIRVESTFSPSADNGVKYFLKVAVLFLFIYAFLFPLGNKKSPTWPLEADFLSAPSQMKEEDQRLVSFL